MNPFTFALLFKNYRTHEIAILEGTIEWHIINRPDVDENTEYVPERLLLPSVWNSYSDFQNNFEDLENIQTFEDAICKPTQFPQFKQVYEGLIQEVQSMAFSLPPEAFEALVNKGISIDTVGLRIRLQELLFWMIKKGLDLKQDWEKVSEIHIFDSFVVFMLL